MNNGKKIFSKPYLIIFFLLVLILLFYLVINKFQKNKETAFQPITINLLTGVHPNLSWEFKPVKPKIFVKPGEVTTVEYMVENLGNKETTGVATFAYFPNQFGDYIKKLNCFCYDAKSLKANQQNKYSVVLFIDPEVTKDSKTKNIKEVTIQFTFFDYQKYKEVKK
jgi:cytochrome c oxidase assembly protein subunit 11